MFLFFEKVRSKMTMMISRRMTQKFVVLLMTICSILFLSVHFSNDSSRKSGSALRRTPTTRIGATMQSLCHSPLSEWNLSIPIILIDMEYLKNGCSPENDRIKIGVDVIYSNLLADDRFDILYYVNDSSKDYLDFRIAPDERRIIPRNFETQQFGKIQVVTDIDRFQEYWKRSKFIECRGINVTRDEQDKIRNFPAKNASHVFSLLRNELVEVEMYPFIMSGTLLGWYRECSIIPHTHDMDMAVFMKDYDPRFLENVKNEYSNFKVRRNFGMLNDSFELTMVSTVEPRFPIDIFFMYEESSDGPPTHHWMGGVDSDGTKYKFLFESLDPWCSGDLHGYLVWMTCTPQEKLSKEYGSQWFFDHPTREFPWNEGPKNIVPNGKWTKEQMKTVYNIY